MANSVISRINTQFSFIFLATYPTDDRKGHYAKEKSLLLFMIATKKSHFRHSKSLVNKDSRYIDFKQVIWIYSLPID